MTGWRARSSSVLCSGFTVVDGAAVRHHWRMLPTAQSLARTLKDDARAAGLTHIHLHQTRHTFARRVRAQAGRLTDIQRALGHRNLATTRVYAQRVGHKLDR